jgi:hypothetical protein
VRLLPDWSLGDIEAHAVFANGRNANPATIAIVQAMVAEQAAGLQRAGWRPPHTT